MWFKKKAGGNEVVLRQLLQSKAITLYVQKRMKELEDIPLYGRDQDVARAAILGEFLNMLEYSDDLLEGRVKIDPFIVR